MQNTLLFFIVGLTAAGCSSSPAPPANTREAPAAIPFEDPLPRWMTFFEKQFGKRPGPTFVGDFNGDGKPDVATRIGSQLFVFHDTKAAEPKEWEVVDADDDISVEVKPASFAIERIPSLKGLISEKQSVFVTGERSPVVVFWYATESTYSWLQAIPKELEAARADAQKRLNVSFGLTKNNMFGLGAGFYGEIDLKEQFAGDFDGDGTEEFLAVETRETGQSRFYLYKASTTMPTIQDIDYAGTKASLHQNPKLKTIKLPNFDGSLTVDRVTPKGAYVEIWNPEKSGVIVMLDKQWKMYWVSD